MAKDANGFIQWGLGPYLAQLECQGTFGDRKAVRYLRRVLQRELEDLDDLKTIDAWQESDPRHYVRKDGPAPLALIKIASGAINGPGSPEEVHVFGSRADAAAWIRANR